MQCVFRDSIGKERQGHEDIGNTKKLVKDF
jgi:hypothetical protein